MRAVKRNKEYTIDESQQKFYQDGGFDILDETGEILAYGRGKTVPYEDYMKAVWEIERLQAKIAEMETAELKAAQGNGDPRQSSPEDTGQSSGITSPKATGQSSEDVNPEPATQGQGRKAIGKKAGE